jgi:hypothetical protein
MDPLLSLVNTGREADHRLAIAEPIACIEVSLFDASSFSWTFYNLFVIAPLGWSVRDAYHWFRGSHEGTGLKEGMVHHALC